MWAQSIILFSPWSLRGRECWERCRISACSPLKSVEHDSEIFQLFKVERIERWLLDSSLCRPLFSAQPWSLLVLPLKCSSVAMFVVAVESLWDGEDVQLRLLWTELLDHSLCRIFQKSSYMHRHWKKHCCRYRGLAGSALCLNCQRGGIQDNTSKMKAGSFMLSLLAIPTVTHRDFRSASNLPQGKVPEPYMKSELTGILCHGQGIALLWWQQRQCVKGGQVSCFVGPLHVSSRCLGDEVHRPAQQIPPAKRMTGQVYEICALPWKPCFQSSIWPYLDQSNAIEMLTVWGLGRPRFALNNFHIYRASRVLHRGKRPRRAELYFWIQTLCSPSRVYSCNTCIAFCSKKGYKINLRTTYDHFQPDTLPWRIIPFSK